MQCAQDACVRDDREGTLAGPPGEHLDELDHARMQRAQRLAAARLKLGIARAQPREIGRPARDDLDAGETRPVAEIALAQPRIEVQRHTERRADDRRRFTRAGQIARDDRFEPRIGERCDESLRLLAAAPESADRVPASAGAFHSPRRGGSARRHARPRRRSSALGSRGRSP
jgi:hypothetical protein